MDPLTIIGAAIAMLGVVSPLIIKYYAKAEKLLTALNMFMELYKQYYTARADNTITDDEYKAMGKDFETLATYINNNVSIPVSFK